MSVPLLEARGIGFCYPGRPMLREINLSLHAGQVLAILGPNGSGKSTLLKVLLGLLRPCRGEVLISGRSLKEMSRKEIACSLAYIPQHTAVIFAYTVLEIVLMARVARQGVFARTSRLDERIAGNALERLGIASLQHRVFSTLSGGERQLVLIARALTQEAPILIMDEPATGLDYGNQICLLNLVKSLARTTGKAILQTTHTPEHALACADEVIFLKRGRIAAQGPAGEMVTAGALASLYDMDQVALDVFRNPSAIS